MNTNFPEMVWLNFGGLLLFGVIVGYLEISGKYRLAYSKFRREGKLNTRVAMFFIYLVPLVVYVGGWIARGRQAPDYRLPVSPYHFLLLAAFAFHFSKRILETLFVHRYSRPVGLVTPILICVLYGLLAAGSEASHDLLVPISQGWEAGQLPRLLVGLTIFAIGELLNLYHHILLSRLRRHGETAYRIPEGGLFAFIDCPHYLYEIIAWIGYAIMSAHPHVIGMVFVMICYLSARSRNTSRWYAENITDYPQNRKSLIPGVF